jgi:FixJ family two-component response regulator
VIVLTGHGSVRASVRAMKAGAIDFLEKPADPALLLARVRDALALSEERREAAAARARVTGRAARLTPRERQVARLLTEGGSSKEIAAALTVSVRTVEGFRSRLLEKMDVSSATELVAILLRTGVL